jgi:hypothetical protein
MPRKIISLFILTFFCFTGNISAQKWPWVTKTTASSYLDMAIGLHGEIFSLYEVNQVDYSFEGGYYIGVTDANGNLNDSIEPVRVTDNIQSGAKAFQMEKDKFGNIYVIIRKEISNENLKEQDDTDPSLGDDEETPVEDKPATTEGDDEESIPSICIQIEEYSPSLELIKTLKLIKYNQIYSIEINDFVIDNAGNFWLAGSTENEPYFFKDKEITPKDGSDFVMKIDSTMKNIEWMKSFTGDASKGSVTSLHLAVNKNGNCILSSSFSNKVEIDQTIYTNETKGKSKMYLVCLNGNGNVVWSTYMNAYSFDTDVAALSGGDFICAGMFSDSVSKGPLLVPHGKSYGMFVMTIDQKTGKEKNIFVNDTSTIQCLCPGLNNDFYCLFNFHNSAFQYTISHFDKKLQPKRISKLHCNDPCVTLYGNALYGNALYFVGDWTGTGSFGDKPNSKFLMGDHGPFNGSGGFVGKMEIVKK